MHSSPFPFRYPHPLEMEGRPAHCVMPKAAKAATTGMRCNILNATRLGVREYRYWDACESTEIGRETNTKRGQQCKRSIQVDTFVDIIGPGGA